MPGMSSGSVVVLILGVLGLASAFLVLWFAGASWRRGRRFRVMAARPIASIQPGGIVKIEGRVALPGLPGSSRPGQPLVTAWSLLLNAHDWTGSATALVAVPRLVVRDGSGAVTLELSPGLKLDDPYGQSSTPLAPHQAALPGGDLETVTISCARVAFLGRRSVQGVTDPAALPPEVLERFSPWIESQPASAQRGDCQLLEYRLCAGDKITLIGRLAGGKSDAAYRGHDAVHFDWSDRAFPLAIATASDRELRRAHVRGSLFFLLGYALWTALFGAFVAMALSMAIV